jgi:hypothetical protein
VRYRFVSRFLLPLCEGGPFVVGRPLSPATVERWAAQLGSGGRADGSAEGDVGEALALSALARVRHARARAYLAACPRPPLDHAALRLGAAAHNLLCLTHPGLAGARHEGARHRVAEAARRLAALGPPDSAEEAVRRHTILERLPDVLCPAEAKAADGLDRPAPRGLRRLLPGAWRREAREPPLRSWLREVGVPAHARAAWIALNEASPLGEALDPLRLDPPWSWERVLPVLRFAPLARLAAARVVAAGTEAAGSALGRGLIRLAAERDPARSAPAGGRDIAFALRFLAHVAWLDHVFVAGGQAPRRGEGGAGAAAPEPSNLEFRALLVAARAVDPGLVYPPDVPGHSELGRGFSARLDAWAAALRSIGSGALAAALDVCRAASVPRHDA